MTLDVSYAAIDRHDAAKEGLFAVKRGAIIAKCVSIVRMAGHFAVKCRECERARVYFAVMRVNNAAMRGYNTAKRLSFAVMRVHQVTIGTPNAAT